MTGVLIDANVLLDVLTEDPRWLAWSAAALERAADRYRLVVKPGRLCRGFDPVFANRGARRRLPKTMFDRESIPYEAAFLAGKIFLTYRRRGGTRRSPLPDFFIGAHAAVAEYRLMTRDAARYRTYFPKLPLIAPD